MSDSCDKGAYQLVKFIDTLEDNAEEHFGVRFPDESILCFCCGGTLEKEDYIVLEENIPWCYLDKVTLDFL